MLAQVSLPRMDRTLVACAGDIDSCNIPRTEDNILAVSSSGPDTQIQSLQ